jgi:flagellar biosynthesis protein FliP
MKMFMKRHKLNKEKRKWMIVILPMGFMLSLFVFQVWGYAGGALPIPRVGIEFGTTTEPQEVSSSIQILLLLTVLSIAPSIIIMMTSFTRIIIVLSFLRNALGTQQMPPNQVLAGLALFLTLFIMNPVISDIYENAYKPYTEGTMVQGEALEIAGESIKKFMIQQTNKNDVALFVSLSEMEFDLTDDEAYKLPLRIVIPSFMISELTTAFKIGFFIYIPFLVIDMVIASTLMSMGMMMVPPVMISLPFKVLLFIMVGGWNIVTQTIVNSFYR